jgi:holo-[acyl-carrier protein] synthase
VIVGIGIDLVNVPRFAATMSSVSALRHTIFSPSELAEPDGSPRPAGALAARFAAKEAMAKALGVPGGLRHRDCEILNDHDGRPRLVPGGSVAAAAERLGVTRWQVSMSLDGDLAMAFVIAEGPGADAAEVA